MSTVLAAIDPSPAARAVLGVAKVLAGALGLQVAALHVRENGDQPARLAAARAGVPLRVERGDPAAAITAALADEGAALAVLGARGQPGGPEPAGGTATAVALRAAKPVVVVPPGMHGLPPAGLRRVLVPLDGGADTAQATRGLATRFTRAGVEVVALHVFDAAGVPPFWDRPEHDAGAWSREFLARASPVPECRLELRTGRPADAILEVAVEEGAGMLALGWHQALTPDHATVLREVLARSPIPVILLPCPQGGASRLGRATARGRTRPPALPGRGRGAQGMP